MKIGHHLSAHTLGLNKTNYEVARKKCNPRSNKYDRKICASLYKTDYESYLYKQRKNELEADRFSGYIMSLYGTKLSKIETFWKSNVAEKDDKYSTHPKLSRRLNAVKEGYMLAEKYKRAHNNKIDIQEIKGYPTIEIDLKQKDQDAIAYRKDLSEKDRLYFNVVDYIQMGASVLMKNSNIKLTSAPDISPLSEFPEFYQKLYQKANNHVTFIDSKESFTHYSIGLLSEVVPEINYSLNFGVHIQNGILIILTFQDKSTDIVYTSIFDKNEVSLKEIQLIFTELLNDGFQKSISKYEAE